MARILMRIPLCCPVCYGACDSVGIYCSHEFVNFYMEAEINEDLITQIYPLVMQENNLKERLKKVGYGRSVFKVMVIKNRIKINTPDR